MIFTHCGQLGDFVYTWPIAAWYHRTTGKKIHFVLPRAFGPFRFIESLLLLQEFTEKLTLVDYQVENYGHGGQPYRFDPHAYGVPREDEHGLLEADYHFNLGLRGYPDKFITQYVAEEYGLGWDPEWVLNMGVPMGHPPAFPELYTEHANFPKGVPRIDLNKDVLFNAQWMQASAERHCWFSSMAVILYFARVPFILYREQGHPAQEIYFPDRSRYELRTVPHGVHPSWKEGA